MRIYGIQIYFMDIRLKKIKKSRLKKVSVSINDVGLRSIYNWKNNSKKKNSFSW